MREPEALNKPDMPAVLDRTHITVDLHGMLLPIFEAISNAIHGIEQRFGASASASGIVADLTPSLVSVLKRHDFKNDWNPKVWFRYRDTEQIAIYVHGYDTMIENAKKRNAAFFTVLLDE